MSEYWKSQPRKFCDFCKCWLSDNKASIEFHESGRRHQAAVQTRLKDIGRKGALDDKKAKKEEEWLRKMEQAAMNDYRKKDLSGANPDLTANIFHQKRAQRAADQDSQRAEMAQIAEKIAQKANAAAATAAASEAAASREEEADEPQEEGPDGAAAAAGSVAAVGADGASSSSFKLRKVEAPKSGTKWHNPPTPKLWSEAKTEDGNTYFWHAETHESRWDPPPEGYLSIQDQEDINKKHEEKEKKKHKKILASQSKHNPTANAAASTSSSSSSGVPVAGPAPKADPFGGWKSVVAEPENPVIDYQAVDTSCRMVAPVATLHDDRVRNFQTKKTPSLKNVDSFEPDLEAGIVPKKDANSISDSAAAAAAAAQPAKPAIVFRKRKINPDHRKAARKPEDN